MCNCLLERKCKRHLPEYIAEPFNKGIFACTVFIYVGSFNRHSFFVVFIGHLTAVVLHRIIEWVIFAQCSNKRFRVVPIPVSVHHENPIWNTGIWVYLIIEGRNSYLELYCFRTDAGFIFQLANIIFTVITYLQ